MLQALTDALAAGKYATLQSVIVDASALQGFMERADGAELSLQVRFLILTNEPI